MELSGKVLGGDNGEGVLIERVDLLHTTDSKGEDRLSIVLSGEAKTVLKDGYNKEAGFDTLDQPFTVSESIPVQLEEGPASKKNLQITFDQMNRAFDLEKPLVNRLDEWKRFVEGYDDEVKSKIEGGRIHFKAKIKDGKVDGEVKPDGTNYYFSMTALAKPVSGKEGVEALLAKIKAKKEAQAANNSAVPF